MANSKPSLIWIANLAALEIHQMQVKKSSPDHPDMMTFDLDPPENYDFVDIKEMGILSVAVWQTTFSIHRNPPEVKRSIYYPHLVFVHVLFGIGLVGGFWLMNVLKI